MSKLSRQEITIFSKEELEKKDIKRLLALKKKLHKSSFSDYWAPCKCEDCTRIRNHNNKVEAQIDLIKEVCKDREHVA